MNKSLKDIPWEKNISNDYHGRVYVEDWELKFEIGKEEVLYGDIEVVILVRGYLNWEGCMNLWFLESKEENCMTHFCSPKCVDDFSNAIKWVWTKGPLMRMWEE